MPVVHRHQHGARRAHPPSPYREQRLRKYHFVGKIEAMRAKIPKLLRSNYDQGGEVPFFSVWRGVFLEYLATTCFVFYACGSVLAANFYGLQTSASVVLAALTQGFAIATLVYAISHTSGGHINPAVTFALMTSGHMGIVRGLFYIVVQLLGAITGAALLDAITPGSSGQLGTTLPGSDASHFQALLLEWIITFTLIFTIFGTAVNKSGSAAGTHSLAPLPIGFAVLIGVMVAFNLSGGSMNPARTFGPAVVSGTWDHHWIYWIGPMGAALVVGLLERYVLLVIPAPIQPAIVEENRAAADAAEADAAATAAIVDPDSDAGKEVQAKLAERRASLAPTDDTKGSFLDKQYPGGNLRRMSVMPSAALLTQLAAADKSSLGQSATLTNPAAVALTGMNAPSARDAATAQATAQQAAATAATAVAEANAAAAEAAVIVEAQQQAEALEMLTGTGEPGDAGL